MHSKYVVNLVYFWPAAVHTAARQQPARMLEVPRPLPCGRSDHSWMSRPPSHESRSCCSSEAALSTSSGSPRKKSKLSEKIAGKLR